MRLVDIESCFSWFGHVTRRPIKALARIVDYIEGSPIVKS